MQRYASMHEFEKAQDIKESIESLKILHEKQSVRDFIE
jgi:excinuclease UvrABC nuclease subunit